MGPQAAAQETTRVLPPVAVTANPLGSELNDMILPVSVLAAESLLMLRMEPTLGELPDRSSASLRRTTDRTRAVR
ncbi:MAG: hypothetical protein U1F51_08565 [Burkholderiales bacterium]